MKRLCLGLWGMCCASALMLEVPATSSAGELSQVSTADTAWMLVATALVMIMTPALALFYSGMVRGEKRPQHNDAFPLCPLSHQHPVGLVGIYPVFRPGQRRDHRRIGFPWAPRGGLFAPGRAFYPAPAFHDVSRDVCRSHPSSHIRGPRRENEVLLVSDFPLGLVDPGIRSLSPLVVGKWLAFKTGSPRFCRGNCGSH